jgi:hypothetical protein
MMDENNSSAIYEFGKEIVVSARDHILDGLESVFQGKTELPDIELFQTIQDLPVEKLNIIKQLIVNYVDSTMHCLLIRFEESDGKYKIVAKDKNGKNFDIAAESDGLGVGLFVFIDEFSKYNDCSTFAKTGKLEKL